MERSQPESNVYVFRKPIISDSRIKFGQVLYHTIVNRSPDFHFTLKESSKLIVLHLIFIELEIIK